MTPMYYRAAAAAILVYDITEPESFKSVKGWVDGTFCFLFSFSS